MLISSQIKIIIVFIIYTFIIYFLVYISNKKTRKLSDYILGDRQMSGFTTALSVGASDMSSWLLMALPGAVLLKGISTVWLPISLSLGALMNWIFISKKLRIASELNKSLTIPEFINNIFYKDKESILKNIANIILIVFFTFYAVAGFVSAAKLTKLTFGLSYNFSLLISALFIIAYTALGGYIAISWIDVLQGILMFFALMIVPIILFMKIKSLSIIYDEISYYKPYYFSLTKGVSVFSVISLLSWGLGYLGQPHIIGRFMSIRSVKELKFARNLCIFWMALVMLFACFVGILGCFIFLKNPLKDPESIFLRLSKDYFNPWINGILICAVLSSIMSTVSCLILMSANSLIDEISAVFYKKKKKINLVFYKVGVIIISSISIFIASKPNITVMQSVAFPWCGLGASFGPIILIGLYWKNITPAGALAGMLTGCFIIILWEVLERYELIKFSHSYSGISILPAFLLSSIMIFAVSKLYKNLNKINI